MDSKKFETVLPLITAALIDKSANDAQISEDEAMEQLYASQLYAALEQEELKVWHYSVAKLFTLYREELATGALNLPEY
jgi:hypothetical protein